eukprot:266606-Rhodomonas_salina.2
MRVLASDFTRCGPCQPAQYHQTAAPDSTNWPMSIDPTTTPASPHLSHPVLKRPGGWPGTSNVRAEATAPVGGAVSPGAGPEQLNSEPWHGGALDPLPLQTGTQVSRGQVGPLHTGGGRVHTVYSPLAHGVQPRVLLRAPTQVQLELGAHGPLSPQVPLATPT